MKLDINLNDYLKTGLWVLKWSYWFFSMFLIYNFMPELMAFIASFALTIFSLSLVNYHWDGAKMAARKKKSGYNVDSVKRMYNAGFVVSFSLLSLSFMGLINTFPFLEMVLVNAN